MTDKRNAIAIIHARGGSKRIPKKNIKDFLGKPSISYVIGTAIQSRIFSHVFVSTDDPEIAEVAKIYGAEIPYMRPAELADDYAMTSDVLLYDISKLKQDYAFDYVCCLYGTSFFTQKKHLIAAYDVLKGSNADSVVPVCRFANNIYRSFEVAKDGELKFRYPDYISTRSQDLPESYYDSGQFYLLIPERFKENKQIYTNNTKACMIDSHLLCDIDTPDDWQRAEILYQILLNRNEIEDNHGIEKI